MDNDAFLQCLRDLNLEEGKAYIQEHIEELGDHAAVGVLIKDEALRQRTIDPYLSLKLGDLLVFFGEYVHHSPSHALGLVAQGDALQFIGDHQAVVKCLDAAAEEFLRLGDELGWARSRMSWIMSCAWLGRTEEALQEATRVHNVFEQQGERFWACKVDHNTAVIYTQTGQYRKALDLYEKMLTIYPTLPNQTETALKEAIAVIEFNQARLFSWLGNFAQAYQLMKQAQESFKTFGETGRIIGAEFNLGDFDYAQGYYGSALRRYYQARDTLLQTNLDAPEFLAGVILRMALCLVKLNRAPEACQLAAPVVDTYRKLGVSLDTGDVLRQYAITLVASGRPGEALQILEEARTLFIRGSFDYHALTTQLQQAELLLKLDSFIEAYEQACLVKEHFAAQGLATYFVRATLVMADALIRRTQQSRLEREERQQATYLEEALLLSEQAAKLSRQHNLQEETYKSEYLLGQVAVIQSNLDLATHHYEAAIVQIEHILNNLVHDQYSSFLQTTWPVYENMISLCLQQSQTERAFGYLERARSMALRQYLNRPRMSSFDKDGRIGAQREDVAPSALQIKNAAILRMQKELSVWQEKYHRYSTQLAHIDTVAPSHAEREALQAELKRCEAKIEELFERLHLHRLDVATDFTSSAELFQHRSHPEYMSNGARNVEIAQLRQYLSPDQLLLTYFLSKGRLVIFAATTERLVTHENPGGAAQMERLLLLLHAHLQPGGWPNLQQPPQQTVRRLLSKLYDLLVAPVATLLPPLSGPLTIVPYGPFLHKLPFHALYHNSRFLVEDFQINYLPASSLLLHLEQRRHEWQVRSANGASVGRPPLVLGYSEQGQLQRALDEARSIATLLGGRCYLEGEATIARLIEESAGSPIIHLATHGQSRLDAPNFSYVRLADGQLNAIDAFSLNLEACELVTLSGCETGLALSSGGDEQLGLGRAFLGAGASSLVMSLWPVEDNATTELMQTFYQHLLSGESKVQALRAAQCSFLQQESSPYSHPYFWAAFRLVGDASPLKLLRKQELLKGFRQE